MFLNDTFGFGADLDPAGGAVALRAAGRTALIAAVQKAAVLKSADLAVGDGQVLAGPRETQRVRAFDDDARRPRAN